LQNGLIPRQTPEHRTPKSQIGSEKTQQEPLRRFKDRDWLLFIGCGDTFADPNFSALIKWLRESMKTAAPEHYALVTNGEMANRHADATWHGFVEPLSYGAEYADLPAFLLKHFPAPTAKVAKNKRDPVKVSASNSKHARLIQDYRAFLLKDCVQMTIEGVRADMYCAT
jgi:hypothetical protein